MKPNMWDEFDKAVRHLCQEHVDQQPEGGMSDVEMANILGDIINDLLEKKKLLKS